MSGDAITRDVLADCLESISWSGRESAERIADGAFEYARSRAASAAHGQAEGHAKALERVRTLARSWAEMPREDDPRKEALADVDRRAGLMILGMLHAYAESPGGAPERLDAVRKLAEGWMTPGGPGLFYPAAGQAVLDAIRGGSTEEEASWRQRAERAETRLAAITALCGEGSPAVAVDRIEAIIRDGEAPPPVAAQLRAWLESAPGWERTSSGPAGELWTREGAQVGIPRDDDDPRAVRGAIERVARIEGRSPALMSAVIARGEQEK